MSELVPKAKEDKIYMPNSEIYLFNVPFSADQKNIIDFSNKADQTSKMIAYATRSGYPHLHFDKCNIIRKDRSLYIEHGFASPSVNDMYNFNYMMYRNDDLENNDGESTNSKWWYAFIINTDYVGKGVTKVDFVIDVWQTFQFDITYRKCMVERSHIPYNLDSFRTWNEPEPLNIIPFGEGNNLNTTSQDKWIPEGYVISQTTPLTTSSGTEWKYGGTGGDQTYFNANSSPYFALCLGEYTGSGVSSWRGAYQTLLNNYIQRMEIKLSEEGSSFPIGASDHRNDLLYIQLIPRWIHNALSNADEINSAGGMSSGFLGIQHNITTNDILVNGTFPSTLGGNSYTYEPRNKKLLSSLCRSFVIYNRSGFCIYIKPEDTTQDNITIRGYAKAMPLSSILLVGNNFRLKSTNIWTMPYSYRASIAYNGNDGAVRELNMLENTLNLTDKFARGITSEVTGIGGTLSIESQYSSKYYGEPMENGLVDIFHAGRSMYESIYGSYSIGRSQGDDTLLYGSDNKYLKFVEIYPSLEQARICDDFLDMYGYARNEILLLSSVMKNRPSWNYIKTINCNLSALCNTNYEQELRNIFNNGVTIWHGFDKINSGYNLADGDNKNKPTT